MKLNKLWVAASMMLALCSCTNEPDKDASWKKMDYPVALSLEGKGALRATQTGSELSASYPNERAVENLTVVVFTHNNVNNTPIAVEKVIPLDKNQMPADPYKEASIFDMGMAGTFQFEVIANGYKDASDKETFVRKFRQGMSYEEFKNVVFDRPLPKHGEAGFVMLNMEPVKVTTKKGIRVDADKKISLRRLACRIDLLNQLPDEIKITKVTLRNQIKSSFLLPQTVLPENSDGGAISYTKQDGNWFTKTVISGGIYSYETPIAMNGYEAATTLLLEGTYNNTPWRKEIEFKERDGRTYIPLLRNHLYRVHLTKGNGTTPGGGDDGKDDPTNADKINYVIEVLDWDEDAAIDYSDSNVMNAESTNPLAFLAENDVNSEGNGFVTDYSLWDNIGFFYQYDASSKRFNPIRLDGELYHVPGFDEWKSIFPGSINESFFASRNFTKSEMSFIQKVFVGGEWVKCDQTFRKGVTSDVFYALRYKGTKYQSAWKYEIKKIAEDKENLEITSRNVKNGVTLSQIASEGFWQQHRDADVVRTFYQISDGVNNTEEYTEFIERRRGGRYPMNSIAPTHYATRDAIRIDADSPLNLTNDENYGLCIANNDFTTTPYLFRLRLFKGGVQQKNSRYLVELNSADNIPAQGGTRYLHFFYSYFSSSNFLGVNDFSEDLELNGYTKVVVLPPDYEITVKEGDATQITITCADEGSGIYEVTVKPGPAATFVLRVTPKLEPDKAQEVVIHRRG